MSKKDKKESQDNEAAVPELSGSEGEAPPPAPQTQTPQTLQIINEIRAIVTNVHIHADGEVPLEMLGPMEIARPGTMKEFAGRYIARIDLEHKLARSDNRRKNVVVGGIFLFLFGMLALGFYALYKGYEWAGVTAIVGSAVGLAKVLSQTVFKSEKPEPEPPAAPRKKVKTPKRS